MFLALSKLAVLFSLATIFLFILLRVVILFTFGADQEYSMSEIFSVFFLSLRFDLKLIATILLAIVYVPAIFLLIFKTQKFVQFVKVSLFILFLLLLFLSFTQFGYYLFFGNGIDILIFGIVDDGTKEVLESILGDQRLINITLASLLLMGLLSYLFFKRESQPFVESKNRGGEYLYLFITIVLLFVLARGTLSTFPLSRKNAIVTDNSFLNRLAYGPFWDLYYANHDRVENDFKLTTKKILKNIKAHNEEELKTRAGYSDTDPLLVHTKKDIFLEKHPPHVIFVQQEGWSTEVALLHDDENNILGEFAKHGEEDYLYESFFSNAYGTSPTLNNLLLNSPISGLSQSKAAKVSFSTSSVLPFKARGYSTTFLSGGSSSWRNHNIFWPRQGFDRYIGRTTIEDHFNYKCNNPWGVYEEYTYEYLKKILAEDIESGKPSFTFVLTTNNHGPIMLPDSFKRPKYNMKKMGFDANDKQHYTQLIGYMYQTDAFGKFLTWLKSSKYKDDVIVVATGDHILKGFANHNSPKQQYLKYAVLTYFYLPQKYDKLKEIPKDIVGSHNDLFPTLYELSLSDTEYYNFGQPIMYKNHKNAFGWQESNTFLFNEGVVTSSMNLLKWDKTKQQRSLLNPKKETPTKYMKESIEKTKNQVLLKKYILVKEYEATK